MTELVLDLYDPVLKKTVTIQYIQKLNIGTFCACLHIKTEQCRPLEPKVII